MQAPITYSRKMISKSLYLKFYPTNDFLDSKNFSNIRKVRGIALSEDRKVCMVSNNGYSNWMLPGGTVEHNENPILALRRELEEEADIEIKNYKLVGFQEFRLINNMSGYKSSHTEMFFIAKIDKVHKQTKDPAKGYILQRDFFSIEDMAYKFMRWGKISRYLEETVLKTVF